MQHSYFAIKCGCGDEFKIELDGVHLSCRKCRRILILQWSKPQVIQMPSRTTKAVEEVKKKGVA